MYEIWFKTKEDKIYCINVTYGQPNARALWDELEKAGFNMYSTRP